MGKFDIKSVLLGVGIGIIITSAAGMIYSSTANTKVVKAHESTSEHNSGIFINTNASTAESSAAGR